MKDPFETIKTIPICFQIAIGHCGNDWLHSLFDSHKQILTIPLFNFHDVWRLNHCHQFIEPEEMFSSWKNYFEGQPDRHAIRKKFLKSESEKETFYRRFYELLKLHGVSPNAVYWAIHSAYAHAKNIDLQRIRLIFSQEHFPFEVEQIMESFPDSFFLTLVRDPRAALAGGFKAAKNQHGHLPDYHFNANIERWMFVWNFHQRFRDRLRDRYIIAQNESLNSDLKTGMERIASALNIDFSESLLMPSLLGEPWGMEGESAYVKAESNPIKEQKDFYSPRKAQLRWKANLRLNEVAMIEFLFSDFMNHFQYKRTTGKGIFWTTLGFFTFLLPSKTLLKHWMNTYPEVQEFKTVSKKLTSSTRIVWRTMPNPIKFICILLHSMGVRLRYYFIPKYLGIRYD
ncbi:MAG: sulfotransferase [Candidatus Nitrohelix vancouverensis]|uniref:Sulfotransferase n=1 Tax=Candidatus Nitrohelix vancouverensis TaxID=2705534 RepID=A0A7T0C051_9BACT|nr:MAG: sulfotransferase [Candidatus Nitrohelix vancouverensis]